MIDIDTMISRTASWLQGRGPESEIVISSRVRLARNLTGYSFSHRANSDSLIEIVGKVKKVIRKSLHKYLFIHFEDLNEIERMILHERHLISREHAESKKARAVAISPDERVSIMVNEEDHLRIQALFSGFQLDSAIRLVNKIDDQLEKRLDYAFSHQYGYLTACPTNVGTGIRASVMMHLPGLVLARQMDQVLQAVSKLGLAVRGWFGEGSEASGNLFQISNQLTLGCRENEIVEKLEKIIRQIIEHEKNARKALLGKENVLLRDRIGRAFGALKYSHMISSGESMNLLSVLRTGIELDVLKGVDIQVVNELFLLTQPAHIQKIARRKLNQKERDEKRAEVIRKILRNEHLE